ncbi:hypothetical protein D3C71_1389810 [compost metagenome]
MEGFGGAAVLMQGNSPDEVVAAGRGQPGQRQPAAQVQAGAGNRFQVQDGLGRFVLQHPRPAEYAAGEQHGGKARHFGGAHPQAVGGLVGLRRFGPRRAAPVTRRAQLQHAGIRLIARTRHVQGLQDRAPHIPVQRLPGGMRHHVAQQGVSHVGAGAAHRVFQGGRMQSQQVAGGVGVGPHPLHRVAAGLHMPIGQGLARGRVERQAAVIRGAEHAGRRDDLADGAYAIQRVAGRAPVPDGVRVAKACAPDDALVVHDRDRQAGHLVLAHVVRDALLQIAQDRFVVAFGDGGRRGRRQMLATACGGQ